MPYKALIRNRPVRSNDWHYIWRLQADENGLNFDFNVIGREPSLFVPFNLNIGWKLEMKPRETSYLDRL